MIMIMIIIIIIIIVIIIRSTNTVIAAAIKTLAYSQILESRRPAQAFRRLWPGVHFQRHFNHNRFHLSS